MNKFIENKSLLGPVYIQCYVHVLYTLKNKGVDQLQFQIVGFPNVATSLNKSHSHIVLRYDHIILWDDFFFLELFSCIRCET